MASVLSRVLVVAPGRISVHAARYGRDVQAVNVVEKFGLDGSLENRWVMPSEIAESLRSHVRMTSEGWVMEMWPITAEIAEVVQPWVDEPIDCRSGDWLISSEQAP